MQLVNPDAYAASLTEREANTAIAPPNPTVAALDVKEFLVGQRNITEGARLRLIRAYQNCAGEDEAAELRRTRLVQDIAQAKGELRRLVALIDHVDCILAALTARPEEAS